MNSSTVTLDVWRVPTRSAASVFWQVATLPRRMRRTPDVSFVKVLGTGKGSRFGSTSADLGRWAALTVWAGPARPVGAFDRIAAAHCRLTLRPLVSRGRWAGREPFGTPEPVRPAAEKPAHAATPEPGSGGAGPARPTDGPLLVLTRARLRPSRAVAFWRAIGPVGATVPDASGLLAAFGVGEAPLGFQGTVSIWADAPALTRFAYRTAEHTSVVTQTPVRGWYAEELFARLAVLDVTGDREVIGWNAERA